MSFFDVVTRRRKPNESLSDFSERIHEPLTRLNSWRRSDPRNLTIYHLAKNLGEDPKELFFEAVMEAIEREGTERKENNA